ncbi:protein IMPACT isoform X2 [Loxodonta africana]|uniref:protein IMPACT isoform X2 n=1 Tax=Loxodonta africana TaxID=9785 RepID=UPI0030D020F9
MMLPRPQWTSGQAEAPSPSEFPGDRTKKASSREDSFPGVRRAWACSPLRAGLATRKQMWAAALPGCSSGSGQLQTALCCCRSAPPLRSGLGGSCPAAPRVKWLREIQGPTRGSAPWLRGQERMDLSNSLEEIYIQNIGESILYLWVEKVRDFLIQKSQMAEPEPETTKKAEEEEYEDEEDLAVACDSESPVKELDAETSENKTETEELPPIDHGVPITDRRSTFQAHLAPVVCLQQVKMVLSKLYENKKIANATHNIYAYRIYCEDKQTFLQDCEDDGETAAGGRLLHLMEILNVKNVLVIVSRWYGGILIGPDRFKHINNCARNILLEKNYITLPEESSKAAGKSKKVKKDKKRSEH